MMIPSSLADVRRADGAADINLLTYPDANIDHGSHRRIDARAFRNGFVTALYWVCSHKHL
jgi:hypothetical protein